MVCFNVDDRFSGWRACGQSTRFVWFDLGWCLLDISILMGGNNGTDLRRMRPTDTTVCRQ